MFSGYDPQVATILLFSTFVFFIVIRVPIAFTLLASSVVTAIYMAAPAIFIATGFSWDALLKKLSSLVVDMRESIISPGLLPIPFFILTGEIMSEGGISRRLIALANAMVGRVRGGLAQVNVVSSMFFGGITGSAVADAASIGSIMIPMMKEKGYDTDYSVGVTISAACQGVLVPPSHNMIIYSVAAGGVSMAALFMAGALPGVLLGIALMISSYIIAVIRKYPKGEKVSLRDGGKAFLSAILGLLTIVIILGGVMFGIFTATESGAFAAVYAFVITFLVYREVPLARMLVILFRTLRTVGIVMALIATAGAFGKIMATLQFPQHVTDFLLGITHDKNVMLLLVNILLLLLGCVMDMAPLIVICTPILFPVLVTQMGVHPVQLGVIMMLNLGIGLITPPVGSALFVGCAIGKISIEKMIKGMVPFLTTMLIVLGFLTYFPDFVLFLPRLVIPGFK